ncbi:MAG: MFS transporter [Candidatus Acidiferrales bacterium]
MDTTSHGEIEAAVISRITWRIVPFLFLLYIVAYLDRINVGFAALEMRKQLGFNDAIIGYAGGAFFIGYVLFQVPSNLILRRVGARRWIGTLMICWGVISSSMLLVRTPLNFYTSRFLLGLAEAGFFPGMIFYLRCWFPSSVRARTVAWFMMAGPLSGVFGGPISGALLGIHHAGLAGWQWLFLIEGLPAVVLGVVAFFYLTDAPEKALWLRADQRAWLVGTLSEEVHPDPAVQGRDLFAALAAGRAWLLILVYFGLNAPSYGISLWLPSMIRSHSGIGNFRIGLLAAIPYVAAAIAMVLVGHHSDRSGERRWHVAVAGFTGGLALCIAAGCSSVFALIVAISLATVCIYSMLGPFWAISTSLLTGAAAAPGIAVVNSLGNLGGFVGPSVIGVLKKATGSFTGGLLFVGAALAISGFLVLLVRMKPAKRDAPVQA